MASIPLSKGKTTILDDEDFLFVAGMQWNFANGYARTTIVINSKLATFKTKVIYLHRMLMGLKDGDKRRVDHINGDKLDNRIENLRICTQSQNAMNAGPSKKNKTGVRGVFFRPKSGKWVANITVGEKTWTKIFNSFEAAVAARHEKELQMYGEFRRTI